MGVATESERSCDVSGSRVKTTFLMRRGGARARRRNGPAYRKAVAGGRGVGLAEIAGAAGDAGIVWRLSSPFSGGLDQVKVALILGPQSFLAILGEFV